MLYPNNQTASLQKELFQTPTSEYRGTPFWAWNGKLDPEKLISQIHIFKEMGLGGFHMHVRTGMDSPYLNEEFMSYIRLCIEKAREEQMLAWLYDEDRWPSGTAGGVSLPENQKMQENRCFLPQSPILSLPFFVLDSRSQAGARKTSDRKMVFCWLCMILF